jgi:hypothetical protein
MLCLESGLLQVLQLLVRVSCGDGILQSWFFFFTLGVVFIIAHHPGTH